MVVFLVFFSCMLLRYLFHCSCKVLIPHVTIISYFTTKSYPIAEQSRLSVGIEYFHHILTVSLLHFSSLGITAVSCSMLSHLYESYLPEMLRGMWMPKSCSNCLLVGFEVDLCSNACCQFLNRIYSLAYSSGNNSWFSVWVNLLCLQNTYFFSCILWASLRFTFAHIDWKL